METGEARAGRSSRNRVRRVVRIRRWLLSGVVALLAVLAGLLGYARYRTHRFLADIPRHLGIDIKSETNGFTLSKSSKGHTLFTVHAAKAIQRENGKTTLHDVAITLYGSPGSNRTDSIRGDEFEYDQPNGVVRATGEVHLDLTAPSANVALPQPDAKRIAVTTRGLVFLQKLGVAATDEPMEIVYGDIRGGATGADYESDTGVLRLRTDVRLDGTQNGRAVHVDAAAAELDRATQVATLHTARVTSGGSSSSGDLMTFALAKGGGIQSVEAQGNVVLQGKDGSSAAAAHLHAHMADGGKLQSAIMTGGVRLHDGSSTASAGEARVRFGAAGSPEQVDLQHAVHVETAGSSTEAHSVLIAGRLVAQLLQNGRRTELRDGIASGGAELHTIETVVPKEALNVTALPSDKKASTRTTVVTAGTLQAVTSVAGGERYISAIEGTGDTRIVERDDLGNIRSSSGDTLHAVLLPKTAGPSKGAQRNGQTGTLRLAVQTGNVLITQHAVAAEQNTGQTAASRQPQDSRATAQRAEFDSKTQRLILTGSPLVTAPGVQLAADRIALAQGSGDAEAQGSVRGTLVQEASGNKGEPVHVIAARAIIAGSGGIAHFYGAGKAARMWTSTAQLQAAELDLDRGKGTLAAHSQAGGKSVVQLVLPAAAAGKAAGATRGSGTVQVTGREMLMTGATAQEPGHIDFSDDVRVVSAQSDLRAKHVVANLKPAAKTAGPQTKSATNALSGGSIDSIVATGDVHLQQPGRSGTGERLLYTEADGRYQLTGTTAAPPSITDSLRGTVTGTTLIFHGSDDSVEVAGDSGRRVHTETQSARPMGNR